MAIMHNCTKFDTNVKSLASGRISPCAPITLGNVTICASFTKFGTPAPFAIISKIDVKAFNEGELLGSEIMKEGDAD